MALWRNSARTAAVGDDAGYDQRGSEQRCSPGSGSAMGRSSGRGGIVMSVVLLMGLSGCAAEPASESPYAAEFEAARAAATSTAQRSVLSDDHISDAEYDELVGKFVDCMSDSGFVAEVGLDGVSVMRSTEDSTVADLATQRCGAESIDGVVDLYAMIQKNPDKRDAGELVLECLVRKEIVPEDFTQKDLDEVDEVRASRGEIGVVEQGDELPASVPDTVPFTPLLVPGGGDINSDEARLCETAPLGG